MPYGIIICLLRCFFIFFYQALKDDGHNPEEYVFEGDETQGSIKKSPTKSNIKKDKDSNENDEEKDIEDGDQDNDPMKLEVIDVDDLVVKDDADGEDEVVDEIGVVDKQDNDEKQKQVKAEIENETTQNGCNSLNDSTTVDNEDSLNLTIGEDEEKIFEVKKMHKFQD